MTALTNESVERTLGVGQSGESLTAYYSDSQINQLT